MQQKHYSINSIENMMVTFKLLKFQLFNSLNTMRAGFLCLTNRMQPTGI